MRDNSITLQTLLARRKELVEEREALDKMIKIYQAKEAKDKEEYATKVAETTLSTRDRVFAIVTDLVYKNRRAVKSSEIFEVIKKTKILKDMKNEQATLAAILDQETKKKNPRLKRVARGVYSLK